MHFENNHLTYNTTARNNDVNISEISKLKRRLLQTEKALRSIQIEEDLIIDHSSHGIRLIAKDFIVKRINQAFQKMSGFSQEEVIGMNCWQFFKGPLCHTPNCSLKQILNGKERVQLEIERNRKDGTAVPCIITALPFYGHDSKLIGIVEIFQDITQLKQLKVYVKESENRYRALIELGTNVGEAIVMFQDIDAKEGIQTFVSDQWSIITGYNKKDLIGRSFFDLVSPKFREASKTRHREKMSGKAMPGLFELSIIRKDGVEVPIELTSASSVYQGKRTNVAYIRDITERKWLEQALVKQRDLAQLYLDVAGVMIVALDANQKVTMINKRGCQILGYRTDEIIGKDWVNLAVPEIHKSEVRTVINKIMTGELEPVEYQENPVITKSGEIRVIYWRNSVVTDTEGNIIGGLISGEDITALKKALDELNKYRNHLEEQVKNKTEAIKNQINRRIMYTRALVHELKTPLTPLIASSDLLSIKLKGRKDSSLLKLAKNINAGALSLSKRIDELLDLVRYEIGILELKYSEVQFNKLIRDIVTYIEPEALLYSISLNTKLPANLPPILCDKERLQQVLLNLLDNAIKFTPKGGRITLSAEEQDSGILVEISDDGCGIAKEDQKHLFDPYWDMESKKKSLSGLGLGLPISKMIIKKHGGKIWVRSQKGKGSTFSFWLPLNHKKQ